MKCKSRLVRVLFCALLFEILVLTNAFSGTASFNSGTDTIEYSGIIAIDDACLQLNTTSYIEKEGANKYTIHKNMSGNANSELDLSNTEIVIDGFLQILAYGKITMNNAIINSINGQVRG